MRDSILNDSRFLHFLVSPPLIEKRNPEKATFQMRNPLNCHCVNAFVTEEMDASE